MNLKGTQTEKNLQAAFSGESMARNKYTFFAEKAKQENHGDIATLFERMAQNESIHGKLLYKLLNDGIDDTPSNLMSAMNGEYGEWTGMYPDFAKTAREEGLPDVADLFDKIATIERDHEHRFLRALSELTAKTKGPSSPSAGRPEPEAQKTVTVDGYRCMFCGATYEKRPDVCSVCKAIGSFEPTQFEKVIS